MKKKILMAIVIMAAALLYYVNAGAVRHSGEISGDDMVHFIDVGQGDSILVESNGKYMLVDAGEEDKGSVVTRYLKDRGVNDIDYVVATHPHSDHIGGMDDVINGFDVKNIIMPDDYAGTKCFENMLDAVEENNVNAITGKAGYTFELGDFKCNILGPVNIEEDANNNSVVMKLVLGNDSILLTGDCSRGEEEDIINNNSDISADVIKVGHHGSSTSSSDEFIRKTDPEIAVISCGKDNDYGHPHKKTVETLNRYGVKVYRTDIDGSIVVKCSGNGISMESNNKDANVQDDETNTVSGEYKTYVLNTNSMKFHYPQCSSAANISEKNKSEFRGNRNELINRGYSSCSICNP